MPILPPARRRPAAARHLATAAFCLPAAAFCLPAAAFCLAAAVLCLAAACSSPDTEPAVADPPQQARLPNFLVIDIDTLAAERVGASRDGRPVTPVLDALAARGAHFTQATSQSGWTMPALASLLTGRWPIPTRVDASGKASWREQGSRDLAEILTLYDYQTAAFWGATLPGLASRSTRGSFQLHARGHPLPARDVLDWLGRPPLEPWFALVHDADLHAPTVFSGAPRPLAFTGPEVPPDVDSYQTLYESLRAEQGEQAAREATLARYDGNLHAVDERLGRMLDALGSTGQDDHTVVIVTSDHGEDLFHHAVFDHGSLYDSVLRIPLLWVDPAASTAGVAIDAPVQTVDLAPSMLERAGIPIEAGMVGHSLLPLLGLSDAPPPPADRPVFSLTNGCTLSVRQASWKLMVSERSPPGTTPLSTLLERFERTDLPMPDCTGEREVLAAFAGGRPNPVGAGRGPLGVALYDLDTDPGETLDRVVDSPDRAVALAADLLTWAVDRTAAEQLATPEPLSAEQEQALKDQGYWGLVKPDGE